ncbi:interferon alpha/beta receptor 1 [Lacerta agilis]|uniref:interferon alpha/beta receptor 1 n=1 Tax=Lacerta agilis TaxID=80427 RepID=UPI001419A28A|nr:interferon alpha/beta receptor 1 [Lacerta agilis]
MKAARALLVAVAMLGAAPSCTGLICLEPPQNITVFIVDTNITLKWLWNNPCGLNGTFSAQYQRESDSEESNAESWSLIPECQAVRITECDLSSAITDYLHFYNVSVRADTGEEHSFWTYLVFSPYTEAQVGPPRVQLESIHGGDVKIIIFSPEANQQRKMWDLPLSYKLTIWKNSSYPQEKIQDIFPGQTIQDLEPETAYCMNVKVHMDDHNAFSSPDTCIQTPKAWAGLPRPEKLQVDALNTNFVLHWDNMYDANVSFVVQFLIGSKAQMSHDISKNWRNVSGCKHITTKYCDLSRSVDFVGIYYLQVQAVNSHNNNSESPWSKMLKFEPREDTKLGPPSVTINASENSLNIFITAPGESEKNPMSKHYELIYQGWYWADSSPQDKKKLENKSSQFIIPDLSSSTLYCLKVQAFAPAYNKSSEFSSETCTKTAKGKSLSPVIFKVFGIALGVIVSIVVLVGVIYYIYKQIKYAFFPSCNPPLTIENIEGKELHSSYLLTSEEPTENCVVIADSNILNEVDLTDFKDQKELEEISQDSGNYSNDDGISRTKDSHLIQEQKAE